MQSRYSMPASGPATRGGQSAILCSLGVGLAIGFDGARKTWCDRKPCSRLSKPCAVTRSNFRTLRGGRDPPGGFNPATETRRVTGRHLDVFVHVERLNQVPWHPRNFDQRADQSSWELPVASMIRALPWRSTASRMICAASSAAAAPSSWRDGKIRLGPSRKASCP